MNRPTNGLSVRRHLPVARLGMVLCAVLQLSGALAVCAQSLDAKQMAEDLATFEEEFLAVDQSYGDDARDRAEALLAELRASLDRTSPAQFELKLAQIVALADNGHSASFAGPRSSRFNRVGEVRLAPFGHDFHVLRAIETHRDLLGARVVSVEGVPTAEILEVARSLSGGVASWRDRNANYFLESPEQMHALGVLERPEAASYELELRSGETVRRELRAQPPGSPRSRASSKRLYYPELDPGEAERWITLLDPAVAPWSLQDPGTPFRHRDAPEINATVLELRQNNSASDRPIGAALAQMRTAVKDSGRRHLVLDLRMNGGGDLNTTRGFLKNLPKLVEGRLFVLLSPWTFSAAISSTGYLEQAAPERVTLVGEAPGDRLEFFAEGSIVRLPHSKAVLLNATERHDYRTGCRDKPDCHRPVVANPIAVESLAPDIEAPWTIDDYERGVDPGMEAVREALRGAER